jgi:5'-nucleotidase
VPSSALRVAIATMGVVVREEQALPGAAEFLQRLIETDFLVLMNNSMLTPRDLAARLARSGLHAPEASIWTSAVATASFLDDQLPGGSAYVVGEAGLTTALREVGYTLTDTGPDFVVLREPGAIRSRRSPRGSG